MTTHTTPIEQPLMVEPDHESLPCDECGAESGEPCRFACTARPEEPDSSPILVRAIVRKPDGDTYVAFGGYVPAWLWDDPHTRELWKRDRRNGVLANFTDRPRQARGYRVTWEAFEEVPNEPTQEG